MYLNVLDKRELGFVLNILINASKTKGYQRCDCMAGSINTLLPSVDKVSAWW